MIHVMDRFSVTRLPYPIRLYTCSREEWSTIMRYHLYDLTRDILCQTILENEITLYVHVLAENEMVHKMLEKIGITDPRIYHAIDLHEDLPGIDHIGIIYRISQKLVEQDIPILYFNTYGHNIVLVSDEYLDRAWMVLQQIAYV